MPGHRQVAAAGAQITLIRVVVEHQPEFPALDAVGAANRPWPLITVRIWRYWTWFSHAALPIQWNQAMRQPSDVHYSASGAPRL